MGKDLGDPNLERVDQGGEAARHLGEVGSVTLGNWEDM